MKIKSKVLFLIIATLFAITSIMSPVAFADEAIPVKFTLRTVSTASVSDVFGVVIGLEFDDASFDIDNTSGTQGLSVFTCDIKYDSQILQPVDPNTLKAIEVNGEGSATDGASFFQFNTDYIGTEDSVSVNIAEEGRLFIFYGGTSNDTTIYRSGDFMQIAFKVKDDVEINDNRNASVELTRTDIAVENKSVQVTSSGDIANLKILPQFTIPAFGSQKQNTTLNVRGRSTIGTDAELPLNAQIKQGENVIEEKQANLTLTGYNVSFDIAEDVYSPGDYTLVMSYGNQTASRSFEVLKKDEVITTDPDDNREDTKGDGNNSDSNSDSDKKDDSTDNSKDDSNSGNSNNNSNNSNTGSTSNGGSVTGIGGNSGDTNSGTSKPNGTTSDSNSSNNQNQNKPANKSNYPTDIAEHWAKTYVEYVYDNALMNGYADGTFLPEGNITRGEFATVMSRLMGYTENSAPADKFTDLNGHWAKGYIGALVEKGIVNGTSDTEFSPDANISRQEIAVLISRAYNLKGEGEKFADDSRIADWAKDGVYAVKAAGYMQGDTDNNFNPENGATRGEVATVITRLHKSK